MIRETVQYLFEYYGVFFLTDFSLDEWKESHGHSSLTILPQYVASQLLHDLDIIQYLGDFSCNRKHVPYYPSNLGWNNG